REEGMAIFFPSAIGGAAERGLHGELAREPRNLIFPLAAGAFEVDLLERNNIGIEAADDARDPRGGQLAIQADTTMDVISHNPQAAGILLSMSRRHARFLFFDVG